MPGDIQVALFIDVCPCWPPPPLPPKPVIPKTDDPAAAAAAADVCGEHEAMVLMFIHVMPIPFMPAAAAAAELKEYAEAIDDMDGTIVVWHIAIDEPIDVGLGPEPPVSEYCSFCGNIFSDNIGTND